MIDSGLSSIKTPLAVFSKDTNRHEGTIATYAEGVTHLVSRYTTNVFIAKTEKEIQSFKKGSLTPWIFSQKSWDLTLECCSVYDEQTLRRFFVEDFNLSIRSPIHR